MAVNYELIKPDFCDEGFSPLLMLGWTINFLQSYFSSGENMEHGAFVDRPYAPDTETGIWIGSAGTFVPSLTEKRPAIVVRHGELRFRPVATGITNAYRETIDGTTISHNAQVVDDTIIVQCLARTYDEAMILGWEALSAFIKLSRDTAFNTSIKTTLVSGIRDVQVVDESRPIYVTGFPVQYELTIRWTNRAQEV